MCKAICYVLKMIKIGIKLGGTHTYTYKQGPKVRHKQRLMITPPSKYMDKESIDKVPFET